MSDLICKQTMSRCNTPGMCAPYGGCHIHVPSRSPREAIANMTEKDWELIALRATVAQQAQMIEHLRGGPTPLYTAVDMANAARDGFRDGVESRRSIMLALTEEIRLDDALIAERDRLLNLFECPDHGQCVPYAMEQVAALRKDLESHKRMLLAAACEIGAIGKALKADMNADGDELLGTVIDLKAQNTRMMEWLKDLSRTSGDKGAVMGARQLLKEFSE